MQREICLNMFLYVTLVIELMQNMYPFYLFNHQKRKTKGQVFSQNVNSHLNMISSFMIKLMLYTIIHKEPNEYFTSYITSIKKKRNIKVIIAFGLYVKDYRLKVSSTMIHFVFLKMRLIHFLMLFEMFMTSNF